ncbi:hypothetical protein PkP19E3_33935 (plasmid) [Pseudomonas koreensis]|nr:hypothetical protein PkP19E3_33935 [Pseudomonas koreensis]
MTSKPEIAKEQPNTWTQGGQAKSSDAAATMAKLLAATTDTADLAQAPKSGFLPDAHKALFDALERVLLDPTIAALPPMEQARLAAQLIIAESVARASGVPVHDAKRYIAGLTYVHEENLEADGHEAETNAPYYYGHSIVTAFEAGAIWQGQQTIESK